MIETKKRLFIGVGLPEEVTHYFYNLAKALSYKNQIIKPIQYENIHLTIKFIGDTKIDEITKINQSIESAAKEIHAFHFSIINKLEGFPNFLNARILYGVIGKGTSEFTNLFANVEDELERIGIKKEQRKFIPHITIARMKKNINFSNIINELDLKKFDDLICCKINLYESVLSKEGANYFVIKEFYLKR